MLNNILQNKKVLIVDDDEISLEALRHALMQAGHEVEAASDGSERRLMLDYAPLDKI